jgi:hypothetical protein
MNRLVLGVAFALSCMLFGVLGAWFWLHGNQTAGGVMLAMIPSEVFTFLIVFAVLNRRGE